MAQNVTYSFLSVHATLVGPGGFISLGDGSGAAEEGINIEPSGEINTMQIGADGTGMHSLHGDKSGKVTVTLLKTSPVNALLAAMYAFQTASGATHGQNTLTLTDTERADIVTCQQVAFTKAPSLSYAKEGGTIGWEFAAVSIDRALG